MEYYRIFYLMFGKEKIRTFSVSAISEEWAITLFLKWAADQDVKIRAWHLS